MNIILWVLQIMLAAHTLMGAFWKFSNSEQAVSSLNVIPHAVWLALSVVEILCAAALVLPLFVKNRGRYVPMAAWFIVAEMILFCIIHLVSGDTNYGPVMYWLVVAALSGFLANGRSKGHRL